MLLRFPGVLAAAPCQAPAVNGPRDVAAADDNDTISSGWIAPGRMHGNARWASGEGQAQRCARPGHVNQASLPRWPFGVTIYSETREAACIGTEIPGR